MASITSQIVITSLVPRLTLHTKRPSSVSHPRVLSRMVIRALVGSGGGGGGGECEGGGYNEACEGSVVMSVTSLPPKKITIEYDPDNS